MKKKLPVIKYSRVHPFLLQRKISFKRLLQQIKLNLQLPEIRGLHHYKNNFLPLAPEISRSFNNTIFHIISKYFKETNEFGNLKSVKHLFSH